MTPISTTHILTQTVTQLSADESLKGLFHQHQEGNPLPSNDVLSEIIQLARGILFPGYYGQSSVNRRTLPYHIGVDIEKLHKKLCDQVLAGLCFSDEYEEEQQTKQVRRAKAQEITNILNFC